MSIAAPSRAFFFAATFAALAGCLASSDGGAGESSQDGADAVRKCADGPTTKGIDVSYYQDSIDWQKVKSAGYAFAFARVSDGTGFLDPQFQTYWAGMKQAGMVRGVYQFFRPEDDPIAQADLLIKNTTFEPGDLPPVLDVEVTDGVSSSKIVSRIQSWVQHVAQATGMKPMIYASPGFWNGVSGASKIGGATDLWVANWGASCPTMANGYSDWRFWQTADSGDVPGIPAGGVDQDVFNGSLSDLLAFANASSGSGGAGGSGGASTTASAASSSVSTSASASTGTSSSSTGGPVSIWHPTPGTTWQWQLEGTIDTSYDVAMYDIDLFDVPQSTMSALEAQGRAVICYFSAGTYEDWRPDASEFDDADKGSALPDWPGEQWLDIRSANVRKIMTERMQKAAAKGCTGVEPDNVDGYENDSGFPLTTQDQIDYDTFIADTAHMLGLSVGLKNAVDLATELQPKFDWALDEQCLQYDECDTLAPFIAANKAVFHVEYADDTSQGQSLANQDCGAPSTSGFSTLIKTEDLTSWVIACP